MGGVYKYLLNERMNEANMKMSKLPSQLVGSPPSRGDADSSFRCSERDVLAAFARRGSSLEGETAIRVTGKRGRR